jgi:hypothetical protein
MSGKNSAKDSSFGNPTGGNNNANNATRHAILKRIDRAADQGHIDLDGISALLQSVKQQVPPAAPGGPAAVDDQKPPAVLTDHESEVDSEIRKSDRPLTAKQLASKTGIGQDVLENHVLPALKRKRGLENQRGAGYFYPS